MDEEMLVSYQSETCELVPLPPRKTVVICHWAYTVKMHLDRPLNQLKARLVVKYNEVYELDYLKTFSPVTKISFVKVLISLATTSGWDLCQKSIFPWWSSGRRLYGATSWIYWVCLSMSSSKISIYELEQSPRAWLSWFSIAMMEFGLCMCMMDHSVSKGST